MTLESKPSGSSHTWCSRFGKRRTFASKEGQYLRHEIAISIIWSGEKAIFQKQNKADAQFQLPPLRASYGTTYLPGTLCCLPHMVVQVEVILNNLLSFQVRVSQVAWQLIFWLKEAKARFKVIQSQYPAEQLWSEDLQAWTACSQFLQSWVVLFYLLHIQNESNQKAWAIFPKADQEHNLGVQNLSSILYTALITGWILILKQQVLSQHSH